LAYAGIFAAAIALIAGSITLIVTNLNKEKKAWEDAKSDLSEYSKATESVKNSYESLTSSISSLGEQYDSLEKMTKGTNEWNEAVTKLNDEALNLIHTYDSLAGKYKIIDGVITFDKGALEDL
jgi:predicted nuclease with TOPRIM domain